MVRCCKRGKSEWCKNGGVSIFMGQKGWEKFKDRFDEEYKDDNETPDGLKSIDVPYEEMYGEPWEFDHVEYWYELTFFAFEGNPYKEPYEEQGYMDNAAWGRYGGPHGGANTFDDMLIECADKVKAIYGNFDSYNDFITDAEKENNKQDNFFLKETSDSTPYISMIRNPNYIDVNNGLRNLRWLKWFIETDYCKKEWDCEMGKFRTLIAKIDELEPEERKRILMKICAK
jgi:hypothetical protein